MRRVETVTCGHIHFGKDAPEVLRELVVREFDKREGREKDLTCELLGSLRVIVKCLLNYYEELLKELLIMCNVNT